jgi:hypothetical protein
VFGLKGRPETSLDVCVKTCGNRMRCLVISPWSRGLHGIILGLICNGCSGILASLEGLVSLLGDQPRKSRLVVDMFLPLRNASSRPVPFAGGAPHGTG